MSRNNRCDEKSREQNWFTENSFSERFQQTSLVDYLSEDQSVSESSDPAATESEAESETVNPRLRIDPNEMAYSWSPVFGLAAVTIFLWFSYYFWKTAYHVLANDAWEMRIADSGLTVGAVFVVAGLYFWFQIALYKISSIFKFGSEFGSFLVLGTIELTQGKIEKFREKRRQEKMVYFETSKKGGEKQQIFETSKDESSSFSDRSIISDEVIHLACYASFIRPVELLSIHKLLGAINNAVKSVETSRDLKYISETMNEEFERFEKHCLSKTDDRDFLSGF